VQRGAELRQRGAVRVAPVRGELVIVRAAAGGRRGARCRRQRRGLEEDGGQQEEGAATVLRRRDHLARRGGVRQKEYACGGLYYLHPKLQFVLTSLATYILLCI